MLTPLDYAVIAFYFLFMAAVGWSFRRANHDSSDFFRGGGSMSWWLVGASAFMAAFSAWTFTGAAGLAYRAGFIVFTIYWANSLGFIAIALVFGAWYRQTRAITVIDAIRQRLGATNEQIVVWLGVPISLVRAAIWLYGLAIFLAPVFQIDLTTLIVVCGVVVVIVSALGGSWAVATGDFMQALLLMPITLFAGWLALERVGGVQPLLAGLPREHFDLTASSLPGFGVLWLVAILIEKLVIQNGLGSAGRFLCVSDTREARRAAVFAAALFAVGTAVWFVPPLAARALGVDLASRYGGALTNPAEAAYAAMAIATLPPGLLGLLVTGLIAATMSSMDVGLNYNAGMFVRGFYHPLLRPQATERHLVRAGRVTTVVMGLIIVLVALKYSTWREMDAFQIMMNASAMLGVPTAVPLFWCMFARRSPDWSAWTTMLVGLGVSLLLGWLPRQPWMLAAVAGTPWEARMAWAHVNEYAVIMIGNTLVCSAWFWATTWWHRRRPVAREAEVAAFFAAMRQPVVAAPSAVEPDLNSRRTGRLCHLYGFFLLAIALVPNSLRGHVGLLFCAAFFFLVGLALTQLARRNARLAVAAGAAACTERARP